MIEIKDFFEKNNSDQDLIIYLNLLLDEKKTYNLRCKEALVTIFSELFSRYNIRLGSEHLEMKRNITKIRNFLLKFFEVHFISKTIYKNMLKKETTNSFQIILSECIISLYHNCFKHKSIEDNMKIFIEPILELFQGKGNVNTHHTSSIFFQEFIQYLINNNYKKEDLRQIGEKILNLFLVRKNC